MSNSNDNHFGGMDTPEAAAERHRARIEALLDIKKIVDRKTPGEHLMNVLGCALFTVCVGGGTTFVILCVDAIIKIVKAW